MGKNTTIPSWGTLYLNEEEHPALRPKMDMLRAVSNRLSHDAVGFLETYIRASAPLYRKAAKSQDWLEQTLKSITDFDSVLTLVADGGGDESDLVTLKADWPNVEKVTAALTHLEVSPLPEADQSALSKYRVDSIAPSMGDAWRILEKPVPSGGVAVGGLIGLDLIKTIGPVGEMFSAVVELASSRRASRGLKQHAKVRQSLHARGRSEYAESKAPVMEETDTGESSVGEGNPSGPLFGGRSTGKSIVERGGEEGGVSVASSPAEGGGVPPKQTVTPTPAATLGGSLGGVDGRSGPIREGGVLPKRVGSLGGVPGRAGPIREGGVPPKMAGSLGGADGRSGPIREGGVPPKQTVTPTPMAALGGSSEGGVNTGRGTTVVTFSRELMGKHGLKVDILDSLREDAMKRGASGGGGSGIGGSLSDVTDALDSARTVSRWGSRLFGKGSRVGRLAGKVGGVAGKASRLVGRGLGKLTGRSVGPSGQAAGRVVGKVAGKAAVRGAAALGPAAAVAGAGLAGWEAGKFIDTQFGVSDKISKGWGKKIADWAGRDKTSMSEEEAKKMDAETRALKEARAKRQQKIVEAPKTTDEKKPVEAPATTPAQTPSPSQLEVGAPVSSLPPPPSPVVQAPPSPGSYREVTSVEDFLLDALNYGRLSISVS